MKKFLVTMLSLIALIVIGWQMLGVYWKYEYGQKAPRVDLVVGESDRHYFLYVPNNLTEPAPILLAFHGGGGGGYRFPQQRLFEDLADTEGFIMAFPEAKQVEPNEGGWQLNTRADWMQDINYVNAIIDDIADKHGVDQKRVYGIGYSLGSMFVYELACHMSDRIAAVASYAGTMPVNPDSCGQVNPVPILHVHGKQDNVIAYDVEWDWKAWDAVGTMRDIPGLVTFWAEKYSCTEETDTTTGTVQHIIHSGCDDNSRIEHYGLDGQDHNWPQTINNVSMHQVLWDFLSEFHLDQQQVSP